MGFRHDKRHVKLRSDPRLEAGRRFRREEFRLSRVDKKVSGPGLAVTSFVESVCDVRNRARSILRGRFFLGADLNRIPAGQVAAKTGANWVLYQELDDLVDAVREINPEIPHFDSSCFR